MTSNSNSFVSGEFPENMSLSVSSSLSIRAPLTLDDDDDDSESYVSTDGDATLSDADSPVTKADLEAHYTSQEEKEEEDCFEIDEFSPQVKLRVTPFAKLSTYDDEEDEEEDEDENVMFSFARVAENNVFAPRIKVVDVEEEKEETGEVSIEDENGISYSGGIEHAAIGIRIDSDGNSSAIDSDVMSQYSQDSMDSEQFGNVIVALNGFENHEMELYGNDEIRVQLMGEDSNVALMESNAEGVVPEENSIVKYLEQQNSQIGESFLSDYDAFVENVECNGLTTQGIAADQSQGSQREKLVSITESLVDSQIELHYSSADFECNSDVCCEDIKIECVESCVLSDPALIQECINLEKDLSETVLGGIQEDELFFDYHSHENVETLNLADTVNKEATIELSIVSQESKIDGSALDEDVQGLMLATVLGSIQEDGLFCDYHSHENVETLNLGDTVNKDATVELSIVSQESKLDGSELDEDVEWLMSADLEKFKEEISALSVILGLKGSGKNSQEEQQNVRTRSLHENMNLPKDDVKSESIYVDSGGESVSYGDESSVFSLNGQASVSSSPCSDGQAGFQHNISENEKEEIQKIQTISVKFLRLVKRINLSLEDSLVSKVLCRLVADLGRRSNQEFVIRSAKISAMKLEDDCQDDLDFSLNILVLGKSGVGKSATINSIFGDMKVMTNAFEPATTSVKEVSGTIDGVKIRILDTPGLRSSMKEQAFNRKILSSVKRYMNKFTPDVILYIDRVDFQTRDLNDLPILRTITSSLGPSVWQHAILGLTHAASTTLDGPSGTPLSYELFVAQKSHLLQQSITKAVGNLCQLSPSFKCPVSLVENHPLCGKNAYGECVLHDGLRWRSQLLALCFSLKIVSQVSPVSGPHTLFDHWKHLVFPNEDQSEPLCHQCSCLLQSPAHLKFSANWN